MDTPYIIPAFDIHLHGLVLDGVYCTGAEGAPANSQFHPASALTREKLNAMLDKIITRILRLLTRLGHLIEEEDRTHRDVAARIHLPAGRQVQRLAALVPRPRLHLIRFHGALAPLNKMRPNCAPR